MTTKIEKTKDGGEQQVIDSEGFEETITVRDEYSIPPGELNAMVDVFWTFYGATKERLAGFERFIEANYPSTEGLNPLIKEDAKLIEQRQKAKRRLQRIQSKFYALSNALDVAAQKFRDEWGLSGENNEK